jgi:hypothetical protein
MTQAKTEAFVQGTLSGAITTNRAKVLGVFMRQGALTLEDVCNLLQMHHKSVSGRISELMDMGLLYVDETIKRKGKTSVSLFRFEVEPSRRPMLIEKRKRQRFDIWIAQGKREFLDYLTEETLF